MRRKIKRTIDRWIHQLLVKLFNLIDPAHDANHNWLSRRFFWWQYGRKRNLNRQFLEEDKDKDDCRFFDIDGRGVMAVSEYTAKSVDDVRGLAVSFSYDKEGLLYGGVLGFRQARALGEFLLERCNTLSSPEEEQVPPPKDEWEARRRQLWEEWQIPDRLHHVPHRIYPRLQAEILAGTLVSPYELREDKQAKREGPKEPAPQTV